MLWRKPLDGFNSAILAKVVPFLAYQFLLPEPYLSASLSYYGAAVRLRNFIQKVINGTQPLKLGVLGGSWSFGCCSANQSVDSYYPLVGSWIQSVTRANVSLRNGAMGSTPSAFYVHCLLDHTDEDVDLVFVEFAPNDNTPRKIVGEQVVLDMEKLVRRLLALPRRPAVVLVENPRVLPTELMHYPHTSEYSRGVLAPYYDIQMVSPHTSLQQATVSYPARGFGFDQLYSKKHPGSTGHKAIADILVHLLQTARVDLLHRPLSREEEELLAGPLPEPLQPGNLPPAASKCTMGADLQSLVSKTQGFTLVYESQKGGAARDGYLAQAAGDTLELSLNTSRPGLPPRTPVSLTVVHVVTTADMGRVWAQCVRGCTCRRTRVEGYSRFGTSHSFMTSLAVTQHPGCVVRLTVLRDSATKGHKFKVNGVVVSDPPAKQSAQPPRGATAVAATATATGQKSAGGPAQPAAANPAAAAAAGG